MTAAARPASADRPQPAPPLRAQPSGRSDAADRSGGSGRPRRTGRRSRAHTAAKGVVFLLALVPLCWIAWSAAQGTLGANPIEAVEIETGVWTLRFLALTLLVTPVRAITGWNWIIRYRRMLGLFTFFYAAVHLSTYIGIDMFFDVGAILHDIVKHPYVTVGMAGFLLLVPLAVTSTTGWIRRLGGRRWAALHRLIYLVPVAGVLHYAWSVKRDIHRPILYGIAFAALLGYRAWAAAAQARRERARAVVRSS